MASCPAARPTPIIYWGLQVGNGVFGICVKDLDAQPGSRLHGQHVLGQELLAGQDCEVTLRVQRVGRQDPAGEGNRPFRSRSMGPIPGISFVLAGISRSASTILSARRTG